MFGATVIAALPPPTAPPVGRSGRRAGGNPPFQCAQQRFLCGGSPVVRSDSYRVHPGAAVAQLVEQRIRKKRVRTKTGIRFRALQV